LPPHPESVPCQFQLLQRMMMVMNATVRIAKLLSRTARVDLTGEKSGGSNLLHVVTRYRGQ